MAQMTEHMYHEFRTNLKLGIIAGGQLGKMLIQEASKWDLHTLVLDPDPNCPASGIAHEHVMGNYLNFDDVYLFGKKVDLLTYEIENINVEALKQLQAEGLKVIPDPSILEIIQDKGLQKELYYKHHIPTAPFRLYQNKKELLCALEQGDLSYPFVQKLRKGGYDGRGVVVVHSQADEALIFDAPSVVEHKITIDKEIAIIAARNAGGEIQCFPSVEMVFDAQANLVEKLICPSTLTTQQSELATKIATELITIFGLEGLLAVEFFLTSEGELVVNEVAPRTHNSGHHTIESVITSQFEQHLRAILNLPLGSTRLKMPAVMLNLLGEVGFEGPVKYEGLAEGLAIEGVKIHLYGKTITRPFRKMGHITLIASELETALQNATKIKEIIKVKA